MSILQFTRVERAEDIHNCQGITFEEWLCRVEAIAGHISPEHMPSTWAAWEHGMASADYALHLLGRNQ